LLEYAVIDTPADEFYDTLNSLVSTICNTPISLISFIDDERQWYKSKIGMEEEELPVEETICQYSLLEDDILEIPDTLKDERLTDNPHVQAENGIRFYAGISLKTNSGYAIGSVCAADVKPQHLTDTQRQALRDIAKMIMIHLEAKRRNEKMETELKEVLNEKIELSEKQVKLQEKIYNNLLEAISQSNAIIEFSKEGKILHVNQQYAEMLGYSVEELIGQDRLMLLEDSNEELLWQKLASGEPYSGKFKRKSKKGETVWVQASYSPVIDLNGEITRITNISVDITKDVLAINALEELSTQKDNFIANVSHELRSPIHAIIGFTDLLLEEEDDYKKQKQLQSVKTAGDSLLYLVNGILDLSKIEAGLFQFDMRDFNLRTTIENVFSILDGKADKRKLSFHYEIEPDVPAIINGDPNRLMQVLINLLDNALKFTAQGEVKLMVSADWKSRSQAAITFVVRDTGIGIPEQKLESVFGRFTQAETNTTRKYGGTGLGLNICKLLVEKQGGTIGVKSIPNEKTEFSFTINFEVSEQKEEVMSSNSPADYSSLQGKVLMCEDNEVNLLLAQQLFATTNLELDVAKNGKIGVEMFRQKEYDLVLMDLQMPEMDGYQATEYIRKELDSETPIIAITAHSIIKEKEKCFEIGMNDYLSKPFKKSELFDKIAAWLPPGNRGDKMEEFQFSLDIIKEASVGNTDFENQMLSMFVEDTSESIEKIKEWHKEENWEAISRQAHQLKSSFGMFLMDTTILNELEKNPYEEGVANRIAALEKQVLKAHNHIHELINKKK